MSHDAAAGDQIQDYVDIRRRPTVVRLDALAENADWLTSSFYVTGAIQEHLEALVHTFAQPTGCGIFLIGQYGSGKSHWLAFVTEQIRQGRLLIDPPDVVPVSLVNYRSATPLEDIVGGVLKSAGRGEDRRDDWDKLQARHPRGLLLVIDELSEFLRSKPDSRSFNEDVRFLQFLGEWSQSHPFWIVAAMQEGIEHTGELEHGLYRKIKDRYPLRFLLSPAHVEDLIRESILIKKPGYEEAVERLAADIQRALPDLPIDYGRLRSLYPLHPATLELLEEVRDRFSQSRGVVDFTVIQLGGDAARGVEPFLSRPMGSLLSPDRIVDHFRDLFEFQPEFLGLAQQVFPYYEKHLPELFPSESARELAERLLKLLVLAFLSPARDGLDLREASSWLLFRATRIDPKKNLEILGRVLRQLAERGRYVVERQGRYYLELRDDGMAALEAFLDREKREFTEPSDALLEHLSEELSETDFNPLRLPRDEWQSRTLRWHFHERTYGVYVGNGDPPSWSEVGLCIRLPWGSAAAVPGVTTLRPSPLSCGEEMRELAVLLRARARPWSPDVKNRLEGRIQERLALLRSQLRAVYRDVEITGPSGERESPPRVDASAPLRVWLDAHAESLLRRRYPAFERYAPGYGPLSKEAYRSLMRFAAQGDLSDFDADEYVKLIREAYLVPMGLLQRQARGYQMPTNLERHELVTLIRPMLEMKPRPGQVYEHAAQSIYGMVPDQTGLLLVLLLILGEIDIQKGRRSYRELYETLPDPQQYDDIVPCRALSLEQLHDLELLCQGLQVREPKEWTVLAQRRTVRQLRDAIAKLVEPLQTLLVRLQGEEQAEGLIANLRQMLEWERTLRTGGDELNAIQQFLYEIGSPRRFLGTLSELRTLPERIDRMITERKRFQHLFGHAILAEQVDRSLGIRIEALQPAPSLSELERMEEWLAESRAVYELCKASYRARHDAFWKEAVADPVWSWRVPPVAACRHVGLDAILEQVLVTTQRAIRKRCTGLVNLDFQPICSCGFDGNDCPIGEDRRSLRSLQEQVEQTLTAFFQQAPIRDRVQQWVDQGLETNPRTLAYLREEAPYPEITQVELLDRHLAGVELVKEADSLALIDVLSERTWEKGALLKAVTEWVNRLPGNQVRFRKQKSSGNDQILDWTIQQSLRHGIALPPSLRGGANSGWAERIRPDWIGTPALSRLDQLGLDEKIIDRIVRWLFEGQVELPRLANGETRSDPSMLVSAVRELRQPTRPREPRDLGELAANLYRVHGQMLRAVGVAWLDRMDALAKSPLPSFPRLLDALTARAGGQYLLIDCLGLPLLRHFLEQIDSVFPHWKLADLSFARAGVPSTTESCYRELVEGGFQETLEKVNRIDDLVHQSVLPFDDFARLAIVELTIASRTIVARLDRRKRLILFADHGFRIAADGRGYCHGGDSTLERVVPVMTLEPR